LYLCIINLLLNLKKNTCQPSNWWNSTLTQKSHNLYYFSTHLCFL
jgi:hypothetical protein